MIRRTSRKGAYAGEFQKPNEVISGICGTRLDDRVRHLEMRLVQEKKPYFNKKQKYTLN